MGFVKWVKTHILLLIFIAATIAFVAATIVLAIQKNNLESDLESCNQIGDTTSTTEEITTTLAPDISGFRLPSYIKPELYNLTLYPNLKDGVFNGVVKITANLEEDSSEIRIHSKNLSITSAYVDDDPIVVTEDSYFELLILSRENGALMEKGVKVITIEYSGSMKDKIVGLYSSSYTGENGIKIPIVASKFEPTYARQAFPCFDEPNMKAKYLVNILKPKTGYYTALSNMPQIGESNTDDGILVHFAESRKMSTYLSCFIVCDFTSTYEMVKPENHTPFPVRVFATPAQIRNTKFALDVTVGVMKYFIQYFGIQYPLPKLDLIAIPDFVSGAMEHWGLVTFRESALLYDERKSSASNKQRVASVIAHELSHSWFGNLVTMDWWNDLWLNEGFASYIENKGVNKIFPEWLMMDQFLIDTLHSVMSSDATPASHPIVQTVVTPDQITEIFDSVTYDKGASILRMLDNAITEEIFQKGVKNYLEAKEWGNSVTQNLWDELQKLVSKEINVTYIMSTWTEQKGYPIVNVTEKDGEYVLTQKRFLKDYSFVDEESSPYGYKWSIPITFITNQNTRNQEILWFKHDQPYVTITKPPGITWIKFNHDQIGYYRVNYSPDHWKILVENVQQMTLSDRIHLMEESFSIAESGELTYDIPLELASNLEIDFHYILWSVGSTKLETLRKYLSDSVDYIQYLKYTLDLVNPAYNELGWDEKTGESDLEKRARAVVLDFACVNGVTNCLEIAKNKLMQWLSDGIEVPQEIRTIVYYYGMMSSDSATWFDLLNKYKAEIDANEKLKLLQALAGARESWLLQHLIQLATLEGEEQVIRSQDYFTMLRYISNNPSGALIVWDYVRENWSYLSNRFGLNDRYLGQLIPQISKSFTSQLKYDEMTKFFIDNPNAGAGQLARQQALANIKNNIKWIEKNRDQVIQWLIEHNSNSKATLQEN